MPHPRETEGFHDDASDAMKSFCSIVITGASSGIGEALARGYAAPGIRLALTGRDATRLGAVAASCTAAGARVDTQTIDVTQRQEMAAWLQRMDDILPVDLLIANAGESIERNAESSLDEALTRRTFATNVEGVFNTVFPLMPAMRSRGAGQIALMSSLAGFIGLPTSAAYNGSKAAVRVWGESLRHALRADGIGVSVICPGFVDTPMNADSQSARPFLMTASRASAIIRDALARDRARIAFPTASQAAMWMGSALPAGVLDRVVRLFAR